MPSSRIFFSSSTVTLSRVMVAREFAGVARQIGGCADISRQVGEVARFVDAQADRLALAQGAVGSLRSHRAAGIDDQPARVSWTAFGLETVSV